MTETKTIEQQNAAWHKDAFEGTEPFNDGATPEVLARIAKRADDAAAAHAENEARKQAAREKREQFKRRVPILAISKQLRAAEFNNEMLPDEMERTRTVLLNNGLVGKSARKGAAFAMLDYIRAHFCAGGGLHILVMKKWYPEEASDVFRIADMARVLFWKYRKPGCFGIDYTNEDLNYTTQRVSADMVENPHIVKLLEDYAKVLLDNGIFSKEPVAAGSAKQKRVEKHFRTSTVMARCDAIEKRMSELDASYQTRTSEFARKLSVEVNPPVIPPESLARFAVEQRRVAEQMTDVAKHASGLEITVEEIMKRMADREEQLSNLAAADCALTQRLTEHEAFFKAAQEVAAKKFETLDRWEKEALTRHAHTINALNAAQEANKSLGEKLVNVLNIALRLMSRVEVLEGVRLNTTTYFPPVPGEITTAPVQPNYQPIVTCDSQQKGVVRTAGVVG